MSILSLSRSSICTRNRCRFSGNSGSYQVLRQLGTLLLRALLDLECNSIFPPELEDLAISDLISALTGNDMAFYDIRVRLIQNPDHLRILKISSTIFSPTEKVAEGSSYTSNPMATVATLKVSPTACHTNYHHVENGVRKDKATVWCSGL